MIDYSELKRLAEAALNDNGDYVALNDYGMAVPPAVVLDLIAEVEELKSDSLCPACEGSGEGWVRSDNGPDAHNIQVDCPECFGPGTMLGAYQAMKIQRDSQIERTVKAGGDLLFMRSERDQLKSEVEQLRGTLCGVMDQVDGNIRATVRDCVNGMDDVQDIYEYCDNIEAIVDLALSLGDQS